MKTANETRTDTSSASTRSLAGKTVLIVEDEPDNATLLVYMLMGLSLKFMFAVTGKEAIRLVANHPEIDLILMDIKLPEMNGFDATRRIKEIRPGLPVIAETAYALAGDKEQTLLAGCDDYLSKPVGRDQLMEKVKQYL